MFKQKIATSINSDYDREKLAEEFDILMGNYCRTGQIMSGAESAYIAGDVMIAYQTTLEEDSLAAMYNDEWVSKRIAKLEDWCNSRLKTAVIGRHIPLNDEVCTCASRDSFILFTTYLDETTPIDCGNCGLTVPIYKIPELTDDVRYAIDSWHSNYVSCDNLNMGCAVGEQWALKQMCDANSQLSKQGIEVCNAITEVTGKPVYYYLFNYKRISAAKDKLRKCPTCKSEWLLADKWHKFYDFKCDKCKLVSTFTSRS